MPLGFVEFPKLVAGVDKDLMPANEQYPIIPRYPKIEKLSSEGFGCRKFGIKEWK